MKYSGPFYNFESMTNKPPRGAHRNRKAGHKFELDVRNAFRDIGYPHLVSTRSESRSRDAQKVDLINKDERINGRFPFNVQCKNTTRRTEYNLLLKEMPTDKQAMNVIVHKMTSNTGKANKKGQFSKLGIYAVVNFDDFLRLVESARILENIKHSENPVMLLNRKKNGTDVY